MTPTRAREILGLPIGHGEAELRRARRSALLHAHPDHGGSLESLALVEEAFSTLSGAIVDSTLPSEGSGRLDVRRDCPSFTISVLPVEAYELLLLAAAELGDVADDDPPYRLDVRMSDPDAWVTLEVVPDAGSSTVTLSVESSDRVDIEGVRDVWVAVLNSL